MEIFGVFFWFLWNCLRGVGKGRWFFLFFSREFFRMGVGVIFGEEVKFINVGVYYKMICDIFFFEWDILCGVILGFVV